jgi:adenosine deaminase
VEIQLDPTSYAPLLGGLEPVLEAALDVMADNPASLTVASSWAKPGDHATELARLAVRYADEGVAGFGLSNDERRGSLPDFAEACGIAADAGLILVPHGGFYEDAWHVRACVDILGAHRIGHGLTAMRDADILRHLAMKQVALEVCPTSYPPLGVAEFADLPFRRLLDANVPVTLGSDDPLLFGSGVTDQYAIAREHAGLTDEELAALARQSVKVSTAPRRLKISMLEGVDDWLTAGMTEPVKPPVGS